MSRLIIHCDGGSRNNPGKAAIGIVLFNTSHQVIQVFNEQIGKTTNNIAEYSSLIKALELAKKHKADELEINMDSELVINQMNKNYKVKAKHLRPFFNQAKELEQNFKKISYNHVSRNNQYQQKADKLVNDALDEKDSSR